MIASAIATSTLNWSFDVMFRRTTPPCLSAHAEGVSVPQLARAAVVYVGGGTTPANEIVTRV